MNILGCVRFETLLPKFNKFNKISSEMSQPYLTRNICLVHKRLVCACVTLLTRVPDEAACVGTFFFLGKLGS